MNKTELISWLHDTMKTDRPYNVTHKQVEAIKDVWDVLHLSDTYEWVFNESFTKILKRKK